MKTRNPLMSWGLVVLTCLGLPSLTKATIVSGVEEWTFTLAIGQSITCVAHYIPDATGITESLIFEQAPEWTASYPFDWQQVGWNTAISPDNKVAYLYGPRLTNDTFDPINLFSYNLFFQWDTEDPYYQENYPVYVDVAVFDGPFGCAPDLQMGWRGRPGYEWEYSLDTYAGPYTNPVPEPATLLLVALGSLALRTKTGRKVRVTPAEAALPLAMR